MQVMDGVEEVATCKVPRVSNPIISNLKHDVLCMPEAEDEPILMLLLGKGKHLVVQVSHHSDVELKIKDVITQCLILALLGSRGVRDCLVYQVRMKHELTLLEAFITQVRKSSDNQTEWLRE